MCTHPLRGGFRFDAIVCDPPYGVRAAANAPCSPRTLRARNARKEAGEEEEDEDGGGKGSKTQSRRGGKERDRTKKKKGDEEDEERREREERRRVQHKAEKRKRPGEKRKEGGEDGISSKEPLLSLASKVLYRHLLALAAAHLRKGGRLVFWVPVPISDEQEEDAESEEERVLADIMKDYPSLQVVYRCRVDARNPKAEWERVLIVVNKVGDYASDGERDGVDSLSGQGIDEESKGRMTELDRLLAMWIPRPLEGGGISRQESLDDASNLVEAANAEDLLMRERTRKEVYKSTRSQFKGVSTDIWRAAWKGKGSLIFLAFSTNTDLLILRVQGDLDAIRSYVKAGGDVNARDRNKTPLFYASGYGKLESVELLVENGAQVNALNGQGTDISSYILLSLHGINK